MPNNVTRTRVLALWQEFAVDPYDAAPSEMQAFYYWLLIEHRAVVSWEVPSGHDRWDDVRGWIEQLQSAAAALRRSRDDSPQSDGDSALFADSERPATSAERS